MNVSVTLVEGRMTRNGPLILVEARKHDLLSVLEMNILSGKLITNLSLISTIVKLETGDCVTMTWPAFSNFARVPRSSVAVLAPFSIPVLLEYSKQILTNSSLTNSLTTIKSGEYGEQSLGDSRELTISFAAFLRFAERSRTARLLAVVTREFAETVSRSISISSRNRSALAISDSVNLEEMAKRSLSSALGSISFSNASIAELEFAIYRFC